MKSSRKAVVPMYDEQQLPSRMEELHAGHSV